MPPRSSDRALIGGGATLALLGLWLGHTIEYVRVWGTRGLTTVLVGSVHAYMLPLGLLIAVVALLLGARLWRTWTSLGAALDAARTRLADILRGRTPTHSHIAATAEPSLSSRVLVAWPVLTAVQISLYLIQENVEAAAIGMPAPGIGAISGVHAFAPLVHAGVALLLLSVVASVLHLMRRRATTLLAVEAIIRTLLRARGRARAIAATRSRQSISPLELFGCTLRQRPPPALVAL